MKRKNNQAQSFIVYCVLIAVVAGVLIAMRVFLLRQVQDKFRQSADVFGGAEQYQKGATNVVQQ